MTLNFLVCKRIVTFWYADQLNTTKYPPSKRNKFYTDLRGICCYFQLIFSWLTFSKWLNNKYVLWKPVNDQIAQRKKVLKSGIKQRNSVLRKDDARSTPKLMQTVVTGTNNTKVTYPSQVGYASNDNSFPEGIYLHSIMYYMNKQLLYFFFDWNSMLQFHLKDEMINFTT